MLGMVRMVEPRREMLWTGSSRLAHLLLDGGVELELIRDVAFR